MRGLIVEESGDQVQCLIDTPKAIEYHGCDGFPDGEVPQLRVLLRRFVHDVANVRIPVEGCHRFRLKAATDSGPNLPPIPVESCH
jgi:hypothetical protein